ncbi:MAG TPA: hypothetical protein VFE34_06290 [Dongiaceae bacterium]|jgi:hypothetical protein|nr:hypothetical protein [Dongiaceae bacterium]
MTKIAPALLLLAGTILLAPIHAALAISSEDAPVGSNGSVQATDPDEALDGIANPNSGTAGSATIDVPPVLMPGDESGDSDDYISPDSEDDPSQNPAPPQDDAPAGSSN